MEVEMEMEMDGNGNVDGCSMHCEALRVKLHRL
jgi:hypothetical protein